VRFEAYEPMCLCSSEQPMIRDWLI